eukprot:GILJ01016456.1.p1 GENE.GILJ01016456.1~~GILJ01016456.1.p1  ORF type:complete len:370 (-),score=25.59 GILJ01016456.1:457-1566(-)
MTSSLRQVVKQVLPSVSFNDWVVAPPDKVQIQCQFKQWRYDFRLTEQDEIMIDAIDIQQPHIDVIDSDNDLISAHQRVMKKALSFCPLLTFQKSWYHSIVPWDSILFDNERMLLPIQYRIPHYLKSHDLWQDFQTNDPQVIAIVHHMSGYMKINNVPFAVLTTYDYHWFFKWDHDQNTLYISTTFTKDTAYEGMVTLISLARECKQHDASSLLYFDNKILTCDNIIGGSCCSVALCHLGSQSVVVKCIDVRKNWDSSNELYNEISMYKRLEHLQGHCVPTLIWKGWMVPDIVYGMIVSHEGSEIDEESFSLECPKISELVKNIHACQVRHNDLAPRNVLVRPDGRYCIIDFGRAEVVQDGVEIIEPNDV